MSAHSLLILAETVCVHIQRMYLGISLDVKVHAVRVYRTIKETGLSRKGQRQLETAG